MKKWMVGLLCGAVLMLLTAAVPANAITGVLFPSEVTFHNGSEVKTIDGTGEDGILNYNNKAYIPLRTFSEAMGAAVEYEPPSEKTNGLHKIDIYQGKASIEWKLAREGVDPRCGNSQTIHIGTSKKSLENDREYTVHITNDTGEDISVSPIELSFQIRSADRNELVYSRSLPAFSGVIPNAFAYKAMVTWDHTGIDGKEVPPGNYFVKVERPSTVHYKSLDSGAEKTTAIEKGLGSCNLGYFQITIN